MNHVAGPAYGLWMLVVVNSLVFILFAFSFARPDLDRIPGHRTTAIVAAGATMPHIPQVAIDGGPAAVFAEAHAKHATT